MDVKQLLGEIRLAQEEHARALAEVAASRELVEAARRDAESAKAIEKEREKTLHEAADQLSITLESIQLAEITEPDETNLALPAVRDYTVEYHANIGCYHCYLLVEGDPQRVDTSSLSVVVDGTRVSIANAVGTWWTAELERKVDAEHCSIVTKEDHVYIRLPLNESDKETADGFSSFSYTAPDELRVEAFNQLRCRGCSAAFVPATHTFEKALPLPSENWMEMFDFWGAGIGSFEHIPRDGIVAHPGRVFVGESHIMVHQDDLVAGAVVGATSQPKQPDTEDAQAEDDWSSICCSKCLAVVGDRRVDNASTLRLQKYLLAAGRDDGAVRDVFTRYTIDSTISAQLLHVAESDGVFRFVLRATPVDTTIDFKGLRLQLLGWDAKIQTTATRPDFRRVLKVVYSADAIPTAPLDQAGLPPMLRTHELLVTPAIGNKVVARLQQSTLLLPPSQREFTKMAVGFLY